MSAADPHSETVTVEVPASAKYSNGRRSPLAKPGWRYVEEAELSEFSPEEWTYLNAQKDEFYTEERANAALRMLETMKDDPSYGY